MSPPTLLTLGFFVQNLLEIIINPGLLPLCQLSPLSKSISLFCNFQAVARQHVCPSNYLAASTPPLGREDECAFDRVIFLSTYSRSQTLNVRTARCHGRQVDDDYPSSENWNFSHPWGWWKRNSPPPRYQRRQTNPYGHVSGSTIEPIHWLTEF